MIGWLCARSDGENYGRMRVYDFSKQELIYGPMQVESRINQNSNISAADIMEPEGVPVYIAAICW
jgi:uncharacterized membrane protein (UPF0182 family)